MDVLSHGLWGTLYGKVANRKLGEPIKLRWSFFWGIFPDVFAFTPMFILSTVLWIVGRPWMNHPKPTELEPWTPGIGTLSDFTQLLYQYSHSLVIFAIVIAVVYCARRSFGKGGLPWILGPWLLHIFFDIPTHSYEFYATPFLWPISDLKFNGIQWSEWWFMILNYGALLVVYLVLRRK